LGSRKSGGLNDLFSTLVGQIEKHEQIRLTLGYTNKHEFWLFPQFRLDRKFEPLCERQ